MKKRNKILTTIIIIFIVTAISVRIALPEIVQLYVNNRLDESQTYSGQVGDVDISLIRGAYSIDDLVIEKTQGDLPEPFISARSVEFSILWSALFNGAIVGEIEAYEPKLNIIDSRLDQDEQTGKDGEWLATLDDLVPLRIDRVTINNGQVHFRNYDNEPEVDIYISEIVANAYNLTNSEELSESLVARIEASARAMGDAILEATMSLDPSTDAPTFDFNLRLLDLPVTRLDSFIRAYAPFDFEAGTIDIISEMAASNGNLEGYIKPLIHNLEVFEWHEDIEEDGDNIFAAIWEVMVGVTSEIFENQPEDQLASNIPISGDLSDPNVDILTSIGNILQNAFIEAFQPNIEQSISLSSAQDNAGEDTAEEQAESEENE